MKKMRLGEIAEVIAGQSPPSKTYNSTKDGLPFFQGKADFQEKYPKVRMWCNSKKRKEAEPGDILISVRAPVGSVNLCDRLSIIGRGLSAIRPRSGIHGAYLYYFFKINENRVANLGTGSTFKSITQDILKKIQIPIPYKDGSPDLDKQTRIATLLSKVESLIAKRKKSIADLDELLKSTFLEMFGDPVRNEMGWDTLPLPKIGKFISGGTPSKKRSDFWHGDFPWVSPKDMKTNYLVDSQDHISEDVFKETNLKKVEKNNVLIVVRGMILVHSFPVAINRCPVAINQDMKAIKLRKEYKSLFLMSCLSAMERQILSLISSAAHGTRRFDSMAMQKVLVPKPPLDLQSQFATIVEKIEALKEKYQDSLNDLEPLYVALSQKAFKGELDLSRIPVLVELKPEDITTGEPQVGKPFLALQDEPVKTSETREQILHRLFNRFISDVKNGALSLDDFWQTAEETFMALMDEDALPLGVDDYDRVRDWLFDMLAQGKVAQVFNEQENRMEIRSVS